MSSAIRRNFHKHQQASVGVVTRLESGWNPPPSLRPKSWYGSPKPFQRLSGPSPPLFSERQRCVALRASNRSIASEQASERGLVGSRLQSEPQAEPQSARIAAGYPLQSEQTANCSQSQYWALINARWLAHSQLTRSLACTLARSQRALIAACYPLHSEPLGARIAAGGLL